MSLQIARPDIAEIAVSLFERPLHPELFLSTCRSVVSHLGMTFELSLHPSGHCLVLRCGDVTVTEVLSDHRDLLPEARRCYQRRLRTSVDESRQLTNRLRHTLCGTVERLPPATFLRQHEELRAEASRANLFIEQSSSNRFAPGAQSLIRTDAFSSGMSIHAYHTFPEQLAVLKTQTLIERSC